MRASERIPLVFFRFGPPTVLSPGHRAGLHALEGQGYGDLTLTKNNTNLTNERAVFSTSPHGRVTGGRIANPSHRDFASTARQSAISTRSGGQSAMVDMLNGRSARLSIFKMR